MADQWRVRVKEQVGGDEFLLLDLRLERTVLVSRADLAALCDFLGMPEFEEIYDFLRSWDGELIGVTSPWRTFFADGRALSQLVRVISHTEQKTFATLEGTCAGGDLRAILAIGTRTYDFPIRGRAQGEHLVSEIQALEAKISGREPSASAGPAQIARILIGLVETLRVGVKLWVQYENAKTAKAAKEREERERVEREAITVGDDIARGNNPGERELALASSMA